MTHQETNRIISKWMGLEAPLWPFDDPKYHSSWSDLMPVVEAIEKEGCIINIWVSLASGCRIFRVNTSVSITTESNSAIKAVYEAVLEYITTTKQSADE